MNRLTFTSRYALFFLLLILSSPILLYGQAEESEKQLLQLKIYNIDNEEQEAMVNNYLETAYLPALHRLGIEPVGVFKPLGQDTTSDKRIYVLTPFDSFQQFKTLDQDLADDQQHQEDGAPYIEASADNPPYAMIETVLMRAFSYMPDVHVPELQSPKSEQVYEFRNYASATELLNDRKVEMFHEGGEAQLFEDLGFTAVFYGDVLSGSFMPNLIYMVAFEDMEMRDQLWDDFFNSPRWDEMSSMERYQNTVSRTDNRFVIPTTYSDI